MSSSDVLHGGPETLRESDWEQFLDAAVTELRELGVDADVIEAFVIGLSGGFDE